MNEDFHAIRRTGIGGSDAGAILGLSPYKTALDVYLEKIGEAPPSEDNAATYWGRKLEDLVAEEYRIRTGRKVERCNATLRHPDAPHLIGHVDRLVWDDEHRPRVRNQIRTRRLLECKTAGLRMADEWGEAGTDQIPDVYLAQVQHYLCVTGCEVADVAVLIGGRDFRLYEVPRDDELIASMREALLEFWSLVTLRVPPEPRTLADIAKRWPRDNGRAVVADQLVADAVQALREAKQTLKAAEADVDALEAGVKKILQDGAVLLGPDGRQLATWKNQTARRLDQARLKAERPDVAAEFTTQTESRVFRLASQKALEEAA